MPYIRHKAQKLHYCKHAHIDLETSLGFIVGLVAHLSASCCTFQKRKKASRLASRLLVTSSATAARLSCSVKVTCEGLSSTMSRHT